MVNPEDYIPEDQSTMPEATMPASALADTEQIREETLDLAEQAREQVGGATGSARGFLRGQADKGTSQVGDYMSRLSQDLQKASGQLSQQNSPAAGVVEMAAERMASAADYMRSTDLDSMVGDLESLARRYPRAFAASGLALGFLVSRFVRTAARAPQAEQQLQEKAAALKEQAAAQPAQPYSVRPSAGYQTNIYAPTVDRERIR